MTAIRGLIVTRIRARLCAISCILTLGVVGTPPAHAVVTPDDYQIDNVIPTHFYELTVQHITTGLDTAYVTTVRANDLATIGWDFTVSTVDAASGTSRMLGALPLPNDARVLDFASFSEMQRAGGPSTVMLSYAAWDGSCRYSVLRETSVDLTGQSPPALGRIWYRSPCFPTPEGTGTFGPLAQSGGRIALVPRGWRAKAANPEFFFSVGDFKVAKPYSLAMSAAARKVNSTVLRISAPHRYSVWASGLRNVQGLVTAKIDGVTQLLSTEHGPRGGDELNALRRGGDYGWPKTDYGVSYGAGQPENTADRAGVHTGRALLPLFAWVPSAGTAAMLQISGPAFRQWWANTPGSADLLIAGLASKYLYRVRIQGGAVRLVEDFRLGARVRSMAQLPSGAIAMGLDAGGDVLIVKPSQVWNTTTGTFTPPA